MNVGVHMSNTTERPARRRTALGALKGTGIAAADTITTGATVVCEFATIIGTEVHVLKVQRSLSHIDDCVEDMVDASTNKEALEALMGKLPDEEAELVNQANKAKANIRKQLLVTLSNG